MSEQRKRFEELAAGGWFPVRMTESGKYSNEYAQIAWEWFKAGEASGMERAIAACEEQDEPRYTGYENPYSFGDGKNACIDAIKALLARGGE